MYTFKMKGSPLEMSQKKLAESKREQHSVATIALEKLKAARNAQTNNQLEQCLRVIYRLRDFVFSQPNRLLYDKSVYINRTYAIVGDLYLSTKDFIRGWSDDDNDLRILYMMTVEVASKCEEEHFRPFFLPYIPNPKKLLEESEKHMALAYTILERIFLYHEMSRCYGQMENYEQARSMARRCAQDARHHSNVWVVNGMFMVARYESLQRNYVDAKNTLIEAVEVAKTIENNNGRCVDFFSRVLLLMDFISSLQSKKNPLIVQREKDMVETMPNRFMKMTMGHILNIISRMPPSSRMMVIPGVPAILPKKKKPKETRKSRLSLGFTRGNVKDRRRMNARNPEMVRYLDPRLK